MIEGAKLHYHCSECDYECHIDRLPPVKNGRIALPTFLCPMPECEQTPLLLEIEVPKTGE